MSQAVNEQRTAAASFILNFYETVVNLKSSYANYLNLLTELKHKYPGANMAEKIGEVERESLKQQAQTTRYYCIQAYIDYSTIHTSQEGEAENPLTKPYNAIMKDFIIGAEQLTTYVVAVNNVLATGIIKDLLRTSQDIITDIYGNT